MPNTDPPPKAEFEKGAPLPPQKVTRRNMLLALGIGINAVAAAPFATSFCKLGALYNPYEKATVKKKCDGASITSPAPR